MLRVCSTLLFALACAFAAQAEGPGSRIGTTPEVPLVPPGPAATTPAPEGAKRCAGLTGARKEECLADPRDVDRRSNGPQSSGTTGGASFGGSAPR